MPIYSFDQKKIIIETAKLFFENELTKSEERDYRDNNLG